MTKPRVCKDCPERKKPLNAPYPGPRCLAHHRMFRRKQKLANHDRRVIKIYGLAPGEYAQRYEAQGGRCAICRLGKGLSRKLAVDHSHVSGKPRGLLCQICNVYLGRIRDNPEVFDRGAAYLRLSFEQ